MARILRRSESDKESDIDTCADEKNLKNKVVNCFHEELPVGCTLGQVLFIGAKVNHSVLQVMGGQPLLKIRSETLYKTINTYMKLVSFLCKAENFQSLRILMPRKREIRCNSGLFISTGVFTYLLSFIQEMRHPRRRFFLGKQ